MVASVSTARIYLDSNVFVAAYETISARSDHAWWILTAIEGGEFLGVTSELTLSEVLVKPLQEDDPELVRRYQEIIAPGDALEVILVTREILVEAARLRSLRPSLRLPDA